MFGSIWSVVGSLATLAGVLLVNTFVFSLGVANGQIVATYIAIVLLQAFLGRQQRAEAAERDGWRYLSASWVEWGVAALAAAMTGLFLYIYLFVGSARADAAFQMRVLLGLIVVFGGTSALMLWLLLCFATRWNDDVIEQRDPLRGTTTIYYPDIESVEIENWSGCIRIRTVNGVSMRVPAMRHGVVALLATIRAMRTAAGVPLPWPEASGARPEP